MANISLFENNPLANSELYKELLEADKNLIGSDGGGRRISLKGMKFRQMVGSEQVAVSNDDTLSVVILDASKITRTYFEGKYDPDVVAKPMCWTADSESDMPSPDVPADQRQATSCKDCPQNIKGSGEGDSRACRYSQLLAVALEDEGLEKVWGMKIPAGSIFGAAEGRNMPLKAYARFLHNHQAPSVAVVTQIKFDDDSSVPKVFFTATRPLNAEELETALELKASVEAREAITLTVSAQDVKDDSLTEGVAKAQKAIEKKAEKKAAVVEEVDEDEEEPIKEPTKAASKKAAVPEVKDDELSDLLDDWDDE